MSSTDPASTGALILIVEDNEKNRKLARDVLEYHGYRTIEATTGEDGIVAAQEHRPALILMDIQLPGIDGISALERLKADPATSSIPVMAVTASVMTSDQRRIEGAGFCAYMAKPISVRELVIEVERALGTPGGDG